jgi:hypothetical protein
LPLPVLSVVIPQECAVVVVFAVAVACFLVVIPQESAVVFVFAVARSGVSG